MCASFGMPRSTAEELTAFGGDGLPHGRRSGFFCFFLPGANGWTDPLKRHPRRTVFDFEERKKEEGRHAIRKRVQRD